MSEFGAPKEVVGSISQISPVALEQICQFVEQRGIRTPISQIVGGSVALTHFRIGSGSPNGVVTGSPPDIYLNTAGGAGTTLYVKESGSGTNTGWVGK